MPTRLSAAKLKPLRDAATTCALCGERFTTANPSVVDHCHKTGNVRGLLCMNCNQGLGKFKDNVDFLASAAMYLHYRNGLSGAT